MALEDSQDTRTDSERPADQAPHKVEVSAATIARMMGVATQTDLKLLEGKIDLLATRINSITAKVERVQTALNSVASSGDMDRLDINISNVKTILRELVESSSNQAIGRNAEASEAQEQSRKLRAGIKTNSKSGEQEQDGE